MTEDICRKTCDGTNFCNAITISAENVTLFAAVENRLINCSFHPSSTLATIEPDKKINDDEELLDSEKSLRQKLKNFYSDLEIPSAVWMEARPQCPIEEYFIQLELKSTKEEIGIEDIFKDANQKRILLEGKPGYGKTTLVTKIVHDWALNKSYLDRFAYVFFLQTRYLRDRTLDDEINDVAQIVGFEHREIIKILKMNANNTLVIIDGLDESTPNQRENVLKVLYKQIYPEMTVLVTCRTGYFTLEREEEQRLFRGNSKRKNIFDLHITVQGITQKNRKKFLCKFTSLNDKATDYIEKFEKKQDCSNGNYYRTNVFESPLLLVLLADYLNETFRLHQEVTNFTSITNFYKMILNLIIRRSEERSDENLSDDFDVFIKNEMTNSYRKLLYQFGSESVNHILKNDLVFSKSEIVTKIHSLGLFVKHRNAMYTRCTTSFEVFHLSILEFLVAFFLYQDFERYNFNEFSPDVEYKMNEMFIQLGKTTLIFLFLMGLLKDKVVDFFKVMKRHSSLYSYDLNVLNEIIKNVEICDEKVSDLLQTFQYFLPSKVHFDEKCLSNLWQRLISKRIEDVGVDSVTLRVDCNKCELNPSLITYKIPLLWLYCKPVPFKEENLLLYAQLPADKRVLSCNFADNILLPHLKEGVLKDLKIDCLTCYTRTNVCIEVIQTLLCRNNLTSLFFSTDNNCLMEEIIELLYTKNNLDTIGVVNESVKMFYIDLNKLTHEGEKLWQNICLFNVGFTCNKPLENWISHLSCMGNDLKIILDETLTGDGFNNINACKRVDGDKIIVMPENQMKSMANLNTAAVSMVESLKNLSLSSIYVKLNFFFLTMQISQQWVRESLKTLVLCFETQFDYEIAKSLHYWENLKSLTNLRFILLAFFCQSATALPIEKIVSYILCLPITHLCVWNIHNQIPLVLNLISQLENSKVSIKLLTLHAIDPFSESEDILNRLIVLLEKKILVKISLLCLNTREVWRLPLFKAVRFKWEKLSIKCDAFGNDSNDPDYIKHPFLMERYSNCKRLSVTLN